MSKVHARAQNFDRFGALGIFNQEAALAALRLESLPTLQADLAELRGKLDAERDARRLAEIAAAELRGQHGKK